MSDEKFKVTVKKQKTYNNHIDSFSWIEIFIGPAIMFRVGPAGISFMRGELPAEALPNVLQALRLLEPLHEACLGSQEAFQEVDAEFENEVESSLKRGDLCPSED